MRVTRLAAAVSALAMIAGSVLPSAVSAAPARADLRGRILLQVQGKGEAWYVSPADGKRMYMKRAKDAFDVMRSQGIGITTSDLDSIPVGFRAASGPDADGDDLIDALETALGSSTGDADSDDDGFKDGDEVKNGYNPRSKSKVKLMPNSFSDAQKGKILLQVQGKGEAWWVNPADGKRYFLGRPDDAYDIMRGLGLGITNKDLGEIDVSEKSATATAAAGADSSGGYTFVASVTFDNPNEIPEFFWVHGEKGPYTLTQYVDDAKLEVRNDAEFEHVRFVDYYRFLPEGGVEHTTCKYKKPDTGAKPHCGTQNEFLSFLSPSGYFLSRAIAKAPPSSTTPVTTKQLLGHDTACYGNEDDQTCYYRNLSALVMYARDSSTGFTQTVTSLKFGVPDAALFVRPTDYQLFPDTEATPGAAGAPSATAYPSAKDSGYTMVSANYPVDPELLLPAWDVFFEKGTSVITEYVDDVSRMVRRDTVYGSTRYSTFTTVQNGVRDSMNCRYVAGAAKPQCSTYTVEVTEQSILGRLFPSNTPVAYAYNGADTRVEDRTVGDYTVPCYSDGQTTLCYYNDLLSMAVYAKDDSSTRQMQTLTIGRPEASALARPAEYDPLPK